MTIIVMPDDGLSDIRWMPPSPIAQRSRSEFSNATKISDLGGGRWGAEATLVPLRTERAVLPWRAFAARLRGIVNSFRLVAVEGPQIRFLCRPAAAAPIAAGATVVPLAGLLPNAAVLRPGQLMTVPLAAGDEQLVTIVEILVADAAGLGTATIGEPLRRAVAAGAAIEITEPWALMRMIDGEQLAWSVSKGQVYGVGFKCEEAY